MAWCRLRYFSVWDNKIVSLAVIFNQSVWLLGSAVQGRRGECGATATDQW